jgi:hypothetical protein
MQDVSTPMHRPIALTATAAATTCVFILTLCMGFKGPKDTEFQVFFWSGSIGCVSYPRQTDGYLTSEKGESFLPYNSFALPTLLPHYDRTQTPGWWYASLPLWPLVAVVDVMAVRAWRRFLRQSGHACAVCGYSRAGLAAGAVCPECGDAAHTRQEVQPWQS